MKKNQHPIVIVDYGVGNLYSLIGAFKKFTNDIIISEEPKDLDVGCGIVLPGVGSFKAGMRGLKVRKLIDPLRKAVESGKPLLGICLGAQLLFTEGQEFGQSSGLDLIKGSVVPFPELKEKEKIPHVGWNTVSGRPADWKNTVLDGVDKDSYVYFVHSYIFQPRSKENVLASTTYGNHKFCSVVKKNNMFGCQFHPEKSGEVGLRIINNFAKLARRYA